MFCHFFVNNYKSEESKPAAQRALLLATMPEARRAVADARSAGLKADWYKRNVKAGNLVIEVYAVVVREKPAAAVCEVAP